MTTPKELAAPLRAICVRHASDLTARERRVVAQAADYLSTMHEPAPAPETAGEALDYCSARWHLENWPDTATKEHIQAVRKTIETLTAALAAANKRAEEAERIVADVNNSVFGSQSFFITPSCAVEIEKIKHLCHEYRQRAEQAEARVAALVAALEGIDDLNPDNHPFGWSDSTARRLVLKICGIARAALATSKQSGGGDE